MPNLYATLTDIKAELGETSTDAARDNILIRMAERASREADEYCIRHFYVRPATKFIDVIDPRYVIIDDCLALTALTGDSEGDGTFDGTTYTQGDTADYILWPDDQWPKLAIVPAISPTYSFSKRNRYLKAVGIWGYGNGESATPYGASGFTGTLSSETDVSLVPNADASATIRPGHTLLIESEQVYVSAVSSDGLTVTVERGVNGTTAVAHTAAAISIYKYPLGVETYVLETAKDMYLMRKTGDFQMEMIGQYQYQRAGANVSKFRTEELLGPYRRLVA